jgi:hypothetical protein
MRERVSETEWDLRVNLAACCETSTDPNLDVSCRN